jgi:hypothetical protein
MKILKLHPNNPLHYRPNIATASAASYDMSNRKAERFYEIRMK